MSPEVWFVLLLCVVVTIPIFVGAVVLANRATGGDTDEDVAELKQRVEQLESERG